MILAAASFRIALNRQRFVHNWPRRMDRGTERDQRNLTEVGEMFRLWHQTRKSVRRLRGFTLSRCAVPNVAPLVVALGPLCARPLARRWLSFGSLVGSPCVRRWLGLARRSLSPPPASYHAVRRYMEIVLRSFGRLGCEGHCLEFGWSPHYGRSTALSK